jgi:ABC-2 type transport system ATP-binding protein
LRFICELKGVKRNKREEHIKEIMELVKISDVSSRLIKNLSKGYKQRVGLAQALISKPDVLILDEPTVGLDPKQIHEMRSVIKALAKEHTIILSSHILAEISMICDRVIIIKNGEIAAIDTPQNLASGLYSTDKFFVKIKGPKEEVITSIKDINGVIGVEIKDNTDSEDGFFDYIVEKARSVDVKTVLFFEMASRKFVIHELRPVDISLEDVFLQLTAEENMENEEGAFNAGNF